MNSNNQNPLFPIFLKIDQLRMLVVGGGAVGLEKTHALLKNDPEANLKVVARRLDAEFFELAKQHPRIRLVERSFVQEDLEDINVAILATDNRQVNATIRSLAKDRNILVNVADTPELCDFYLGATVRKGDLKIGISTNGKSPTFAKRFRQILEDILPEETNALIQNLHSIRNQLVGNFSVKVKKLNEVTKELVN